MFFELTVNYERTRKKFFLVKINFLNFMAMNIVIREKLTFEALYEANVTLKFRNFLLGLIVRAVKLESTCTVQFNFFLPLIFMLITCSRLKLQKTTCHLQQNFFNIFEPNRGIKGPENHSLD
jgi:hypothetical protein